MLNIPSTIDDPNYRYTMPRLLSKVEGRGNGIRTNIMNMADISKALKRAPEYTTKFFGCELGTLSKFESAEGKAIVNGSHMTGELQGLVDKFIERFVLCPVCHLPEVDLHVTKGLVQGTCNACGQTSNLDNSHRLATYIVKNPPKGSTMGGAAAADLGGDTHRRKTKEDRKREKEEKKTKSKKKGKKDKSNDEEGADGEKGEKVEKEKKEKKKKKEKDHDEKDGKVRDKEKKEKKEKKKKDKEITSLITNPELSYDSKEMEEVAQRLENLMEEFENVGAVEFFHEARALQVSLCFSSALRMYSTFCAILKRDPTPERLEENMHIVRRMVDSSISASDVLVAFEEYFHRQAPTAIEEQAAYCLQKLYQSELLEEDDILDFYKPEGRKSKEAKKKAKEEKSSAYMHIVGTLEPFLDWLDDEDESEEPEGEQTEGAKSVTRRTSTDDSNKAVDSEVSSDEVVASIPVAVPQGSSLPVA